MAKAKLPRAANDDDVVALQGRIWNKLADMVERRMSVIGVGDIVTGEASGGIVVSLRGGQGDKTVWVKVHAAAAGGGKYDGYELDVPTVSLLPTDDLTAAMLGVVSTRSCLIFNAAEEGQSTHELTDVTPRQHYWPATFIGMSDEVPSRKVYRIDGKDAGDCTETA